MVDDDTSITLAEVFDRGFVGFGIDWGHGYIECKDHVLDIEDHERMKTLPLRMLRMQGRIIPEAEARDRAVYCDPCRDEFRDRMFRRTGNESGWV